MILTGNVQALFISFAAVCAALIIYDIVCSGIFRRRNARIRKLAADTAGMEAVLRRARKMRSEERLLALEAALESLQRNAPQQYQRLKESAAITFAKLLRTPQRTDEIVLAYIVFLAAEFGLFYHTADTAVKTELLFLVTHERLYLREIALHCIYSVGEAELVLRALRRLDSSGVHHPCQLLREGLKEFAGERRELAACFAATPDKGSPEMQAVLTDYISAGPGKSPAEEG